MKIFSQQNASEYLKKTRDVLLYLYGLQQFWQMKIPILRLVNLGILLAFSICYLEWGGGNSSFIFQAEYELFKKTDDLLGSLTHPLILAGLIGQILLLYSIFSKKPNRRLNTIGVLVLSPVVLLALLAGVLSLNWKMITAALPFVILTVIYFVKFRRTGPIRTADQDL